MSFGGKVVVVTGASSGIGAATAQAFAREGVDVVLVARNEAKLAAVAASCARTPLVVRADVSADDGVRALLDQTLAKYGKIDVLVNNAGIVRFSSIADGTVMDTYDEVMRTNFRSVVHLTSLAAPHLIKTKGNVVNVSSIASQTTIQGLMNSIYGASKATMDHFTRSSALELAPLGVRVNAVNPGPVMTEAWENAELDLSSSDASKTPLDKFGQPDEIADLVLYLAGDKAKGITGSLFVSDNGFLLK